jgi:hypothetical protein
LGSGNGYGRSTNKAAAVEVELFRRAHFFVNPSSQALLTVGWAGPITPIGMARRHAGLGEIEDRLYQSYYSVFKRRKTNARSIGFSSARGNDESNGKAH